MDRGSVLMGSLLSRLRAWFPFILRATHAHEVSVVSGNMLGEFEIQVRGVSKNQEPWGAVIAFRRDVCFGSTYQLTPAAWQVVRRPCDHARDIVREVLKQRGVLQ